MSKKFFCSKNVPKSAWLLVFSDNTTYTFSMPAGNVSVEAVFEEDQIRYETITYVGESGKADTAASLTEPFYANYNNYNNSGVWNGTFKPGNAGWDADATLIKVNASDLVTDNNGDISTTLESAVLTFHTVCTASGANSAIGILRITGDIGDTAFEDITFETLNEKTAVAVWSSPANVGTAGADETADLTADLRKAGGSAIYAIVTKSGRQQEITNLNLTLTEAENPISTAAITVQKVYSDESGAITIGDGKYTALGEAEQIAASADYFVGDSFTPAATYKNATDDTENKTTRYEYVSGADTTVLAAATNTIYVIYNKIDYVTTTFKVTLPEAAGEGGETVNVKLTGTPTSTGTPAAADVDTDVAVIVEEGQTVGTATYKLLPGDYKYSFVETETYVGVDEADVTVGDENAIALTANAKTGTKITVKYVDADKESTDEGYELKTAEITYQVYVGESYTIDNSYTAAFDTSADATPYKKYAYQADGSDSLTVASPVADNNVVTLKFKSDGTLYYYENDCTTASDWTVGASATFTVGDGYASVTSSGSGNRTAYTKFDNTTQAVNSGVLKVSFDIMRANNVLNTGNAQAQIALFDSSTTPTNNAGIDTSNCIWQIFSGSAGGQTHGNRLDTFAINEQLKDATAPNIDSAAHPFTFTGSSTTWFNVTIYVDLTNHKETYIITNKATSTVTNSEYNIDIDEGITGIGGVHIQSMRAGGAYCMDNIEVTSGTMPTAPAGN